MRLVTLLAFAALLSGCQTGPQAWPKPDIPAGSSQQQIDDIYCHQSQASPWYVPCANKDTP